MHALSTPTPTGIIHLFILSQKGILKDAAHANDILALAEQLGYGNDKVTAANKKTTVVFCK